MNRLWIGIGILIILLALGLGLLWGSTVFFREFSRNMEQAAELALGGNWSAAVEKAMNGRSQWERYRRFWSAFTDHEPVEEMQDLFSQLEVYQARCLEVDFATICHSLSHLAEAIDESHNLRWWSVL